MCAKLRYDLLTNTVKPIDRKLTEAKIKPLFKKLLTKCSKFKLQHKHPRLEPVKRTPKTNSLLDGSSRRPTTKRKAELELQLAQQAVPSIAMPPTGIIQGHVISTSYYAPKKSKVAPVATNEPKADSKKTTKSASTLQGKHTNNDEDTESDGEEV